MSPRRPRHLRLVSNAVPDWVREERNEPSYRPAAARGKGARRAFGKSWWGQAWVDAIEGRAQLDPNRLPRGRGYARSGAVGDIDIAGGLITARVQGSRKDPYDVTVRVRVFADDEWERVLRVVAAQVGRTAALLDGELPPEVADDVHAAGLSLLPGPGEVQPRCSCPDWADPCKHAAAVCYLVADALDEDPFALLRLRGRTRDEVLAALRRLRSGASADTDAVPTAERGVVARAAFDPDRVRPALPAPPLPPAMAGGPAALASDPPTSSGITTASLAALAADAALRAHALLIGDDFSTAALDLDVESDVVRRVAAGTASASDLIARELVPWTPAELARRAEAWRVGGPGAFAALTSSWDVPKPLLDEAATALGVGARRQRNRVTSGDVQLRFTEECLWYPFTRVNGDWQLAGPGAMDPAVALASLGLTAR